MEGAEGRRPRSQRHRCLLPPSLSLSPPPLLSLWVCVTSIFPGVGVWTISNCLFTGADNLSPTAISSARKYIGYTGTDAAFDFGAVYGTTVCDKRQVRQVRILTSSSPIPHLILILLTSSSQVRSEAFLRDLAKDHKLTKADLMLTLSDHEHGADLHEPYVAQPSFHVATIDWHTSRAGCAKMALMTCFLECFAPFWAVFRCALGKLTLL